MKNEEIYLARIRTFCSMMTTVASMLGLFLLLHYHGAL
jgi:hypothetical protein